MIWHALTEPYWRIRWWLWFMRAPLTPALYNLTHAHQITKADYEIMEQRWEAREPKRGVPPDVRRHRARQIALYGPDPTKWGPPK